MKFPPSHPEKGISFLEERSVADFGPEHRGPSQGFCRSVPHALALRPAQQTPSGKTFTWFEEMDLKDSGDFLLPLANRKALWNKGLKAHALRLLEKWHGR